MKTGEPYWNSHQQRAFDLAFANLARPLLWRARVRLQRSVSDPNFEPIFTQKRVGRGIGTIADRLFEMDKLQTLDANDQPVSPLALEYREDGHDELAQIRNILRGDMSACGWRSTVPTPDGGQRTVSYEEIMDNMSHEYHEPYTYVTQNSKPGMLDEWGVWHHLHRNDPVPEGFNIYDKRAMLTIHSAHNASLAQNMMLIAQFAQIRLEQREAI